MKISIICLIYDSIEFTDFVLESVYKHTPELKNGEADFYFVVNNTKNEKLLEHLEYKKSIDGRYKYHECNYTPPTIDELKSNGFQTVGKGTDYIPGVYKSYNYGVMKSTNPLVVTINSDHSFSKDWLKNLKKRWNENVIVASKLVQPHSVFTSIKNGTKCDMYNCGFTITNFNEDKFLKYSEKIKQDSVSMGNAYMPVMCSKEQFELVGGYPEGNVCDDKGCFRISGDHEFTNRLMERGIKHITSNDSIVYHLQEGEKHSKI